MTAVRAGWRIGWVLVGVLGCGGRSTAADDAGADDVVDASSVSPFAGTWDATRNECPAGIYTELRDATWTIRLTDATFADVFTAQGCQATNAMIPLVVQGNHLRVDLSSGAQSCVPSPCQGNYSSTDTASPAGVSYSILVCPKQIPAGRWVDIDWTGDVLAYTPAGASCVQRFARRK